MIPNPTFEERQCMAMLAALAQLTNREMTPVISRFYQHAFASLGFARVTPVLKDFMRRGKWPSVAEVESELGQGETSVDERAAEIPHLIESAIRTWGRTNPGEAMRKIGPVGWQIVTESGGWELLCSSIESEAEFPSLRKLWRDAALAKLKRNPVERFPELPKLPEPENPPAIVRQIAGAVDMEEKGENRPQRNLKEEWRGFVSQKEKRS